mmetsp:Transcript_15448/g.32548  ORF Transcript_15448/g.32548 Transcript_15448/m.32548 type:complete len:573 (-) Transcript_15448:40-1758(-)
MSLRAFLPSSRASSHAQVVQLAAGGQHALLLTDEGIVYSWGGKNDHGQLGRRAGTEKEPSPVTDALKSEVIVQVACGRDHCLALSERGALFTWGANKAGQLGVEGFKARASSNEIDVAVPMLVKGFDGQDASMIVKSCSCGPESSACVTTRGEVYVWGAVSYYLFGEGNRYARGENCTIPVRVHGVPPEGCRAEDFSPDKISVYKDRFACTLSRSNVKEDLMSVIAALKSRSAQLLSVTRHLKSDSKDRAGRGSDNDDLELEEMRNLDDEFKRDKASSEDRLRVIEELRENNKRELQRIGRELTICDQQDTALTEFASSLELKKGEAKGSAARENRTLETQLNDINHFKASNRRSRLQLLAQRDKVEQEHLHLTHEYTIISQKRQQVEARSKLIRSLQRGRLSTAGSTTVDECLKIASSKREELLATDLQTLAGVGRFTGVQEVLAISHRALQEVSSALKEVSAAASGSEGTVLEEALEANLKLRKDCNALIQERLVRAELGIRAQPSERSGAAGNGGSPAKKGSSDGLHQFFHEASWGKPKSGDSAPGTRETRSVFEKMTEWQGLGGMLGH